MSTAGSMQDRFGTEPLRRTELDRIFLDLRQDLERSARRRIRPPDLAADIVQEVFIRWQNVDRSFDELSDARAYLYRMVANFSIDHLKVEGRRSKVEGRRSKVEGPRFWPRPSR